MSGPSIPELHRYLEQMRSSLSPADTVPLPAPGEASKSAAVLVPFIMRDGELHVLYTRRSDRLNSHRGQVAFPGGRFDKHDPSLLATALRETHEEIGIESRSIEILGSFEGRQTNRTEIFVTPFVGLIRPPFELRPDPWEVAEIFDVPLDALTARRYRGYYDWEIDGIKTHQPAILYRGQVIWGLTYYLTLRLLELVRDRVRQAPATADLVR
jgi:8-oxo-dGTP pyrophosphatase MutT (NUDIX family)